MRAVALVAIALTSSCLADKVLLWPQKSTAVPGAKLEQIRRPEGALEVVIANSSPGTEPMAFVLRFYGNAQLANDIAYEAAAFSGQAIEWGELPGIRRQRRSGNTHECGEGRARRLYGTREAGDSYLLPAVRGDLLAKRNERERAVLLARAAAVSASRSR